jgi:hypothetical protein
MARLAWQFRSPVQCEVWPATHALTWHFCCSTIWAMALLRGLFWLALFVFFTFCFIVLFEYGTHDFANGFQQEAARVKAFVLKQTSKAEQPKK